MKKITKHMRMERISTYGRYDEHKDYMPPAIKSIEFFYNGVGITFKDGTHRSYTQIERKFG